MPRARRYHAAAAHEGRIYVAGGKAGGALHAEFDVYDAAMDSWSQKVVLPTPRSYASAAVFRGRVYFLGGYDGSSYLRANEEYDPVGNAWAAGAAMPTARGGHGTAVLGGRLYALGGDGCPEGLCAAAEDYDPLSNAWSSRASLPAGRGYLAAAAMDGRIYAVGGYVDEASSRNEEYDPGSSAKFEGLAPNTRYAFKAKARSAGGAETAESPSVSTWTLAALPGVPESPFTQVSASSLSVHWSSGSPAWGYNPVATLYRLELSTRADFSPVAASSATYALSAAFSGLSTNATYHARVRAINGDAIPTDDLGLGTILTAVETPVSVHHGFRLRPWTRVLRAGLGPIRGRPRQGRGLWLLEDGGFLDVQGAHALGSLEPSTREGRA
jgi:kelch-like protein 17 (actinfilin)/kelch-like protein 20